MIVDLFLVYQFIKRLVTPFNEWEAYKQGIIDDEGNILKKRKDLKTVQERQTWGKFDVMILKIKKLLEKVPGGKSRLASYAAALWLIKEGNDHDENMLTEELLEDKLQSYMNMAEELLDENKALRWKKAGPNGEIEITHNGQRYKIEKALDHNERHKGEFKIMAWDKRREEWVWDNTVRGKAYAKELVMDKLDEETNIQKESVDPHADVVKAYKKTLEAEDQAADYNYRGNKARVTRASNHLSKMIKKHHPDLDMKGKIALRTKLQNMKEDAPVNAAGAGAIAGIGVGPDGEPGMPKKKQKEYVKTNKTMPLKRFKDSVK